jgi:hypothetical protein
MARPRLERALELLSEQPISETERLEAQWALARALAAADERDAALAQARAAADGFVALGPAWTERAHEITAWIDEQH